MLILYMFPSSISRLRSMLLCGNDCNPPSGIHGPTRSNIRIALLLRSDQILRCDRSHHPFLIWENLLPDSSSPGYLM